MRRMASEGDALIVGAYARIPLAELRYRFARASGAGGQHVNKTETAVELLFDLAGTPSLTEAQRRLALSRLKRYLDGEGVLHLESRGERSQLRNREAVTQRFVQLLHRALIPPRQRVKTRPPRRAAQSRLKAKQKRAEVKRLRRRVSPSSEG